MVSVWVSSGFVVAWWLQDGWASGIMAEGFKSISACKEDIAWPFLTTAQVVGVDFLPCCSDYG